MTRLFSGDEEGGEELLLLEEGPEEGEANGAAVEGVQRYGFRVDHYNFLFPEGLLGEVVSVPEICPIPHTRHWVVGVLALRANLIPVFDLHGLLFDVPATLHKPSVLVLGQGKRAAGFLLQEPPRWLTGLVEMPLMEAAVPEMLVTQIDKAYRQEGMVWLEFNGSGLFTLLAENAKSC